MKATPTRRTPPSIVVRKDGRRLRRMTVYLPPGMHKRIALHCVEAERDMSDVIAEVLTPRFGGPGR